MKSPLSSLYFTDHCLVASMPFWMYGFASGSAMHVNRIARNPRTCRSTESKSLHITHDYSEEFLSVVPETQGELLAIRIAEEEFDDGFITIRPMHETWMVTSR